jgi:uncharacterized protein YbaP (TraB family)
MAMMLQTEEEMPKCQKLHFYKIQNVSNNAYLYLLGSNHVIGIAHFPKETVDLLVSSNRLFVEIYDSPDAEEDSNEEFHLSIKELENRLEPKGFFRREVGVGFLDKYEHGSTEILNGWFNLVKDKISPQLLELMDQQYRLLNYENAESFYNHYHPVIIPLMREIFDQAVGGSDFLEEDNGMDNALADAFTTLGKPVYGLETDLDRIFIAFEETLNPWLSNMTSLPFYSLADIEDLAQSFEKRFKEDTEEDQLISYVETSQKIEEELTSLAARILEERQDLAEIKNSYLQIVNDDLRATTKIAKLEQEIIESSVRCYNKSKELLTKAIQETRILWESDPLKEVPAVAQHYQTTIDRYNLQLQSFEQQIASEMRNLQVQLELAAIEEAKPSKFEKELELCVATETKLAEQEQRTNELRKLPTGMDRIQEYLKGDITEDMQQCKEFDVIQRNKNWFSKFQEHLEKELEKSSGVVGVAHLYGPEGLLNLFANIPHYTVTRWDSKTMTFKVNSQK